MNRIKNAKITKTMLGWQDHGILTCTINLDYGDAVQSFGGYSFDYHPEGSKERQASRYGMEFIAYLMRTVGVKTWEELPGTVVRVECSWDKVWRIGHFLEDKWFDPQELADDYKTEEDHVGSKKSRR